MALGLQLGYLGEYRARGILAPKGHLSIQPQITTVLSGDLPLEG